MAVAELFFSHEEHSDVSSPAGGGEELKSVDGFLRPGQGYRPDAVIFQEPAPLP